MLLLVVAVLVNFGREIGWRPMHRLETRWSPGILAPKEPEQEPLSSNRPFHLGEHRIIPLATFKLFARVLLSVPYPPSHDNFQLSPIDLVVGWGPLSDSAVIDRISFGHGYRIARIYPDSDLPLSISTLGRSLSHIHAIPEDPTIEQALRAVRSEDLIDLEGYLVSVESPGMLPWTSSLTRDDSGCEIVLIRSLRVRHHRPSLWEWITEVTLPTGR